MDERLESNKRNAKAFYDLMFNESRPADAIRQYAATNISSIIRASAMGKEAFIDYFTRMASEHLDAVYLL